MSPQDYEYLLVAANLAQFHPKWGFSIKILKWKLFVEGHQFLTINCMGTMEVSSKKLDLNAYVNGTKPTKNREKCHFIRIGVMRYMQCKGRRCGRHTAWKDVLSQHYSQDSIFQWLSGPRRQRWLRMKFLNLDSPSRLDCALRSGSPVKLFMFEACDQFREGLCILTFAL